MSSRSRRIPVLFVGLCASLISLQAVAAQGSGTIYASRAADGHLTLSDSPIRGAVSVSRHDYVPQTEAQQMQAAKERAYWHDEAVAYSKRHQAPRRERAGSARFGFDDTIDPALQPVAQYGYAPGYGMVHAQPQAGAYTSSPGAVSGRVAAPFIGSGFSRAR